MKKLTEKLKKQYGITLIALIVTIIVLLILAGVVISTLTGENGMITKAVEAAFRNEMAAIREQVDLKLIENSIDNISWLIINYVMNNCILLIKGEVK